MAPPDLLSSVGFEKHGLGYHIRQSSMLRLLSGLGVCFLVGGSLASMMMYDIRFEKKSTMRKIRHLEHHASGQIVKTHMELLNTYKDEVKDWHNADKVLHQLESLYATFKPKFAKAVDEVASDFNLDEEKTLSLHNVVMALAWDMQRDNVVHSKPFLKHLISAGKHAAQREANVSKQLHKEAELEAKLEEEDYYDSDYDGDDAHQWVEGFFSLFHTYEREIGGQLRYELEKKGEMYNKVQNLWDEKEKLNLDQKAIIGKLEEMKLADFGANITHISHDLHLHVDDVLGVLVHSPRIPYTRIRGLEEKWREKTVNSHRVLADLVELREADEIPHVWFEHNDDEDDEDDEDEDEGGA